MNGLLNVRGKGIYVETCGSPDASPLLYVHGGPGAGCYDFMEMQRQRLGPHLFLIAMDQRGAFRSEPIVKGERFGLDDLVDDLEALRLHLGIPKWTLLGHSFGGYLALLYASRYPHAVRVIVYDCPTFDYALTLRSLLAGASILFEAHNKYLEAEICRKAMESDSCDVLLSTWEQLGIRQLGAERHRLYLQGVSPDTYERLFTDSPFASVLGFLWERSNEHARRIYEEGKLFHPVTGLLSSIKIPSLLLKGSHDLVCCPVQLKAFQINAYDGSICTFPNSGHFVWMEEPDAYAESIIGFVNSGGGLR